MDLEVLEVFDSCLAELSSLEERLRLRLISEDQGLRSFCFLEDWVEEIRYCKSGLRFLKIFFWSLSKLDDTDAEISHILIPVNRTREDMWGISTFQHFVFSPSEITKNDIKSRRWMLNLQDRIRDCKQKFEEPCELLLRYLLTCNPLMNSLTVEFSDDILEDLKDLYKYDENLPFNDRITTLEKKVTFLHNLFNLAPVQLGDSKELRAFNVHVLAQYSASLVFMYGVKAVDEEMTTQLNLLLFTVLQQYRPCVPVFKSVYIRFLEEMKLRGLDSLPLRQIIPVLLDLLLENLVDILKDDFLILQESLIFVISFLAQPPDVHGEDEDWMMIITAEIEFLVKEHLYLVLSVDDMNGNLSEANTHLSDFLRKVELVKGKILHAYDRIWDSFSYDFPKTNGLGFFDFLLQNIRFLKEKLKGDPHFIPFAKNLIIKIEEELMSLRPYLDDLFERQKEQKQLKDIWLKVIDLAYQTEYAINSCSVTGYPLWYNMARLMQVLGEIKDVNSKLKKIEGRKTHDAAILHCSAFAPNRAPEGPQASSFNEVMVGLEEEVDIIVGNLLNGSKFLDIVAIVGMPGLGKTTMANKVYNAPAVRNHFHVFAYCIVSQVYSTRMILLDILGHIKGKYDKMFDKKEEELADMLRKCLLGKRYLIIMDDIWDVKSWDEVKSSLPNNQNGSKVIFTTRNRNVALQAKKDCILHHLRFLSDEESWELLRKKTFNGEGCPPTFLEVGKMISKNCKGLPLTIVLIAGLLRTEISLSWWNKISETTSSYVLMEDCMNVLELSYQHLPEHLKPCFLYFGAFVEDSLIRVNKLTLLWIAEGFVQNSNRVNLKNVAREYLSDLVDRSLVIADEKSSYGGIKSCRIHDLVHELCQKKAQEENIFQLMVNDEASNSSSSTLRNPYRVCMHMKGKYVSDATDICPNIHSLLFNCKWEIRRHDRCDLSNLKLVQVMDLEELDCNDCFIREMHSVVHLRFMSISFSPEWQIRREFSRITLNDLISNFWNLEMLILKGPEALWNLPEAFWNLTRLRHVRVDQCYLSNLGVKKREAYPHPQMVNLESFSSLHVPSTEDLEVFLQISPSLRKLSFCCTTDCKLIIHFPKLDSLSKLESLKVACVGEACLRSFNFLSSLKKLSLSWCYLEWRYLPVISKMPCLEVLKLLEDSFVAPKWDLEDTEFPKLKFLQLRLLNLAEWIAYVESFPSLEVLIVAGCDKLKTIPPCFGEMLTLKRIEVYASHKSVASSVVEIQELQKDFGNEELQVIIPGQYDRI